MKPKILFIMHMPPPVHGAAMVGKYIHDSEEINSRFDCRYINLTIASSLEDIGKFRVRKILSIFGMIRNIRRTIKSEKPDLVYITPNAGGAPFYKEYLVVRTIKRLGCKIVAHYHNKGVSLRQDRLIDDILYKRFFKGLKVILLSEMLFPDVKKYVSPSDVFFCPNGVPDVSAEGCVNEGAPHILFLSNLLPSKGVFVLLDALKVLKKDGVEFFCDFVGGETEHIDSRIFLDELAKRGLTNQEVMWHGQITGTEKEQIWSVADCFALPSDNECFPLVVLEAMQHGIPVISTYEGAIPGIVDDGITGYLVSKQDPAALAEKLRLLLEDPQRRMILGQNGKRKFKEKYTLSIWEERMSDILKQLCD